jgi:hypothetical protein
MKWAIRIGLLMVGVIAVVAGVGWSLPVAHTATRQTMLAATPASVYAVISDVERYPTWWPEISGVEMLPTASGRIRFREHMSTGSSRASPIPTSRSAAPGRSTWLRKAPARV